MPPPDRPPATGPLNTQEQVGMLTDSADKISPRTFPVPTPSPDYIESLAAHLRTSGESVSDHGNDINSSWAALTTCYKAPEAEELYTVLSPVAIDGAEVSTGLNNAANALENFAEDLRGIKTRWSTLRTEAYEFRAIIDAEGDDWRKASGVKGFFGIGESPNVEKNNALVERGTRIIEDYEEAERVCANKINYLVPDRTTFEAMPSGDGDLDDDVFYHGYTEDLSDLATEWGMGGATTDEHWWVDTGAAVWDYGVGAVEDTGAMLGLHSSQGWLAQSWGDSLYEYHEGNIQSALGLVGMYDAESDSYGWSGMDTVGSAWKDLAHSVVPWEEWGERPGYVIGTALLNIGATVGGALLTATGVGAVVGVPLMAWRGMAIIDGMGGRGGGGGGGGGSGTGLDVDLPDMANLSRFGGDGSPLVRINDSTFDPDSFSPQQLSDMRGALDRLQHSNSSNGDENPHRGSPSPRHSDDSDSPDDGGERSDPTVEDLITVEDVLNPASPESTRLRDEYQGDFMEADARTEGAPPGWEADPGTSRESSTGPEPGREPATVGGRPDSLTEQASSPTNTSPPVDLTDSTGRGSDADRVGERDPRTDSRTDSDGRNDRGDGSEKRRDSSSDRRDAPNNRYDANVQDQNPNIRNHSDDGNGSGKSAEHVSTDKGNKDTTSNPGKLKTDGNPGQTPPPSHKAPIGMDGTGDTRRNGHFEESLERGERQEGESKKEEPGLHESNPTEESDGKILEDNSRQDQENSNQNSPEKPPWQKDKSELTTEELEKRNTFLENVNKGIKFNHEREPHYAKRGGVSELIVGDKTEKNGDLSVDSYIPGKEIISRKYTQLSSIQEKTALGYVEELVKKYPPGTMIPDFPSTREKLGEHGVGKPLKGEMFLEVPSQDGPVPKIILERAEDLDITIRDVDGKIYSTDHPSGKKDEASASNPPSQDKGDGEGEQHPGTATS